MRFIITFLLVMLCCFILWSLMIWGQMGNPTKMSQWIYDTYQKKQKISQSIKGRKIIIVAGSNALFGVNSKMLEQTFNLPVVNYSVNAGIELPVTLFMAQKVIKEGDIVIMPLEYPMFSYDGSAGVQMIDFIFSREPGLFNKHSMYEQLYMLWHVTFERVLDGYKSKNNIPIREGLYGAHNINAYGDQINTDIFYKNDLMYTEIDNHQKKPEVYGQEFDSDALGWEYLNRFVLWCKEKDVKVIFMPSTLMKDESYYTVPEERWLYTHIADEVRKRGWLYIGNPYDYMYEKELYFNTNYHLINSARDIRTQKMIYDLNKSEELLQYQSN